MVILKQNTNIKAFAMSILGGLISHVIWFNSKLDNSFIIAYTCGIIVLSLIQMVINAKEDKKI